MSSGSPPNDQGNWPQYPPPNHEQPAFGQPNPPSTGAPGYPPSDYPQAGYPPSGYPPSGYPPAGTPPGYNPYQQAGYGYGYAPPMPQSTSGWAIASLVCGILGLCTGIAAILAVIFGHISLNEIKKSNGQVGGRGLAMAGLIMGYIELALGVILVILIIISAAVAPSPSHPGTLLPGIIPGF